MSAYRLRCGCCGRSRPEEETTLVSGHAVGNYRRAGRRIDRRVCRSCTQECVDSARQGQAEGRNCPVNDHYFAWEQAARVFGISISGLRLDQMTDRRAP